MTILASKRVCVPMMLAALTVAGCPAGNAEVDAADEGTAPTLDPRAEARDHEDGTYRGIFADGDAIQVNVELELRGGVVQRASFRHLRRDENYNLGATDEPYSLVVQQYRDALDHLVGKPLEEHLRDLYTPGEIVSTEVDGYSAATIRSNKLISAIRDALNRGVYSY